MGKNIRILVVDDFSTMRQVLKTLLGEIGFTEVEEADDGVLALSMLETGRFDFLATDWHMPGMDGIELVKKVRENPELSFLPILMVSTEARREQIVVASGAGVDGYLVKPFTAATLQEKIDNIFERLAAA